MNENYENVNENVNDVEMNETPAEETFDTVDETKVQGMTWKDKGVVFGTIGLAGVGAGFIISKVAPKIGEGAKKAGGAVKRGFKKIFGMKDEDVTVDETAFPQEAEAPVEEPVKEEEPKKASKKKAKAE